MQMLFTYILVLDKLKRTNEIFQANLIDTNSEMIVTLNVCANCIEEYQVKLHSGKGMCIKILKIAPQTNYGHGECKRIMRIMLIDQDTSIENIEHVC